MVKSRVPPSRGSAVGGGTGSLLLALMALVLLGLAPGAPPLARDALGPEEAARCGPETGPVRDMVTWERLCRATMRAASRLPDSDARRMVSLVGPRHLATLHTLTSLWLGPRGKPVVEDVVTRAWPSLPARPGPEQRQRVSHALWRYVNEATFARTQEDLAQAALALGEAVAAVGVEAVVFLLDEGLLSAQARLRDAPREELLGVVPASARAGPRVETPEPGGCATPPPGWPDMSSAVGGLVAPDSEELLAPFLSCTSLAGFVGLQRGVDMVRLVRALDDWSAVRLGARGPVLPEAAELLNRKRAFFLAAATREYGVPLAEVFALFVLHAAFDKDVGEVLHLLAQDKRLGQTLGQMPAVLELLRRRGFRLSDYPERAERPLRDGLRGALQGVGDAVLSTPVAGVGVSLGYVARKEQLPPRYQKALDAVEDALAKQALEPGRVALGVLDELTLGAPLGFYYLAVGVGQGAHSLAQGQYEQAARELTPAALLVALYAGGKGARYLSEARVAPGTPVGAARPLQAVELHLEELKATVRHLREQLGEEGLQAVARYLRGDPEAALLVIEGGEAGVVALHEARGHVPRARDWLSQAKSERPGSTRARGGAGRGPGGMASLVDEGAGLTREVVDTKLRDVEREARGPRLSGDVAALEKQLEALEKTPPAGASGEQLWSEYLEYGKGRLADLRQGRTVKGMALEPPLKWEGYQRMREGFARGVSFERDMARVVRDDALRPKAQRQMLQDFDEPLVEMYVGVHKPKAGLRFADVLVIERKPLSGQPPRVETFSFKSRDFSGMDYKAVKAQMIVDARAALTYYGETLNIRRPGLEGQVKVRRIRLIYQGGELKPTGTDIMRDALRETKATVPGVEVLFR